MERRGGALLRVGASAGAWMETRFLDPLVDMVDDDLLRLNFLCVSICVHNMFVCADIIVVLQHSFISIHKAFILRSVRIAGYKDGEKK
jgi:hypothetical protein